MAPIVKMSTYNRWLSPFFTRRGFTFIELMIAGTMIAVLFVGLAAHLRGGITVWRETTRRIEQMQQEQDALERLARDLAQGVRYYTDNARYGQEGLPAPQWSADSARWYAIDAQTGLRLFSYACTMVDEEAWLVRTTETLETLRAPAPVGEPPVERLLPGCVTLALRYAYLPPPGAASATLDWQAVWPDNPAEPWQLPRLVEVKLTLKDGRQLQRLVAIPQGLLKAYTPGP